MIKKLMAALAVAALATFGVQAPAQAAWSDCNYSGTVCLSTHSNWGTPVWRQTAAEINGCRDLTGFDNVTTMVSNKIGGHVLVLYRYLDCQGETISLASGNYYDFTNNWWNDKVSSVELIAL